MNAAAAAGLTARVLVHRGPFTLAASFDAAPGRVTALLGPNGSGKTTLLAAIAGLQPVDEGRITLDGDVLDDSATGAFLAPERRRVGVVFQDSCLFAHMSVLDNVAFGPRSRGRGRRTAEQSAREWLRRLEVDGLAARRPSELSGGQAQRVALARALAAEPDLLLLDEPLAALDAATRLEVRRELRSHLAGFAGVVLLVTHDPLDAMVLADDVIVLEDGRITQRGTPEHVAGRPATDYVATLMGANVLRGTTRAGLVQLADGTVIAIGDRDLVGEVIVAIRPEAISLHARLPEGSPRNVWPVRVAGLESRIDRILVHLTGPPDLIAAVTPASISDLGIAAGSRLWASVKALDLEAYARPAGTTTGTTAATTDGNMP